jgi:predicted ester cyclase
VANVSRSTSRDERRQRISAGVFHVSRGDFQGHPPTGKQIEIGGVTIERIKDGKIVERWVYSDRLGVLQQHGLVPPPQANR